MTYQMPPEWAPHAATWLAWPNNPDTWQGRLKFVPPVWIAMIKALHIHEPVHLLIADETMEVALTERLRKADIDLSKVHFHKIPTNDCWLRDSGPTFVKSPQPPFSKGGQEDGLNLPPLEKGGRGGFAICWIFNSWGEKWPPWDLDAKIGESIAELASTPLLRPGIVMEGGSIETNGAGALLTTESCLLSKKRNPKLNKADITKILKDFLGIKEVIWLQGEVPAGDDTDGHIDNLARFVDPQTVVTPLSSRSPDYQLLAKHFRVIPLPSPQIKAPDGSLLPASYANFYIANGVVLVPIFGEPTDEEALAVLRSSFPKRRIVPINCRELVLGFGGIHCVTQQQPL